jgi:hypothetical protein
MTHFRVQYADRIGGRIIRTERVGAYQFGKPVGLVGGGCTYGPHFVQYHLYACTGDLPGRFGACHSAADDMYGVGSIAHTGFHITSGLSVKTNRKKGGLKE